MKLINLAFFFAIAIGVANAFDGAWYCLNCCHYVEASNSICDLEHPNQLLFDTFATPLSAPMERSTALYDNRESIHPQTQSQEQLESVAESSAAASLRNIPEKNFQLTLKRPSNSFFLYKQERIKLIKYSGMSMSQRVTQIAKEWHAEPQEVRDIYTQEQNEVSTNFRLQNPDYKYSPKRSPQVAEVKQNKKMKGKGKVSEKS